MNLMNWVVPQVGYGRGVECGETECGAEGETDHMRCCCIGFVVRQRGAELYIRTHTHGCSGGGGGGGMGWMDV